MFVIVIAFSIPWIPIFIGANYISKYIKFISHSGYRSEVFHDTEVRKIFRYAFYRNEFIKKYSKNKKVSDLQRIIQRLVFSLMGFALLGVIHILLNLDILLNIWDISFLNWNRILPTEETLMNNIMLFLVMSFLGLLYYINPLLKLLNLTKVSSVLESTMLKIVQVIRRLVTSILSFFVFSVYMRMALFLIEPVVNIIRSQSAFTLSEQEIVTMIMFIIVTVAYKILFSKKFIEPLLLKFRNSMPHFDTETFKDRHLELLSNDTYLHMVVFYFIFNHLSSINIMVEALVISFMVIIYFENRKAIMLK